MSPTCKRYVVNDENASLFRGRNARPGRPCAVPKLSAGPTCCFTLGSRAHPPGLPVHGRVFGWLVLLARSDSAKDVEIMSALRLSRREKWRGWTDEERSESALYLPGSVTDPAVKAVRPGGADDVVGGGPSRPAGPAVGPAACPGSAGRRVRPGAGLRPVRAEQRTHARLYMLARKAERLDLSLVRGGFREGTPVPPGPA